MIKLLCIFLFMCFSFVGNAQTFQNILDNWTQDPVLKSASVGVKVIALKTGEVLGSQNSQLALIPASNLKLLTTAAALDAFIATKTFKTELLYSGKIENGILKGDLILKGYGDPTLGSKYNGGYQKLFDFWLEVLNEKGIKSVTGRVVADASFFPDYDIPRTWIWEDIGNYYGSGVSALSFIDNTFRINFSSPSIAGKLAKVGSITPEVANLYLDNLVLSSNKNSDNAYVFGGPYNFNKKVEGTIPKSRNSFGVKASLPDPALQLAFMLRNNLIANGIPITGSYTSFRNLKLDNKLIPESNGQISVYEGMPLKDIVYFTNKNSVNLYAEHLHRLLGMQKYEKADVISGNKAVLNFLKQKGLPVSGVSLMDGSGLSRFNTVTVDLMTSLLVEMESNSHSASFKNSLAISGESGTFNSFMPYPISKGKVIGKSGYMERVRSYSGYIDSPNGRLVFSIIVNNYECSASEMKKKIELLLLELF